MSQRAIDGPTDQRQCGWRERVRRLEDGSTALLACGDCEGSSFGDEGRVVVVQSPGGDMLAAAILKAFSGARRVV